MGGLTAEGLAGDLAGSYSDWGDTVTYGGTAIEGFLSTESAFDPDGETKPGTLIRTLHSPTRLAAGSTVEINGQAYRVSSREERDGEFEYRLTR